MEIGSRLVGQAAGLPIALAGKVLPHQLLARALLLLLGLFDFLFRASVFGHVAILPYR
jgi:hypothetical protein